MAERLALILQLGHLKEEAAQRGDSRAVATCEAAAALLLDDKASVDAAAAARVAEQQRKADAARRKQRQRDRKSQHVTGRHEQSRDPFEVSPDPFLKPEEDDDDTAREDSLSGLLQSRVGPELWPDVNGFLRRRGSITWPSWIKEMLSVITGGNATIEDLAQVCRDDGALDREIGSPRGLRTFVATAARDRLAPPGSVLPRPRGGLAQRTFDNGRNALEGLP